jgi:hypothetical protein
MRFLGSGYVDDHGGLWLVTLLPEDFCYYFVVFVWIVIYRFL